MSLRDEMAWQMFKQFWRRQGGEDLTLRQIMRNWRDLSQQSRNAWLRRADTAIDVVLPVVRQHHDPVVLESILMEGRT